MENPTMPVRDLARSDRSERYDRIVEQRTKLRTRHSQALSKLMTERDDLRGVHALADFVDDSLRWSA